MRASRGPKRTLRTDLQKVRGKAGPALVVAREFLLRAAALLWGLALRGTQLALRGVTAAAAGIVMFAGGGARVVRRAAAAGTGALSWGVAAGSRAVTPKRTLAAVTLAAAGLLAASQFTHYTGVRVGTPQYAGLEHEAPAPVVQASTAGSAHAWALLGIAIVAAAALVIALHGRWRVARLVSLAGLAGLAVALIVDLPKGLRAGAAGVNFAGAKATLLPGFYVEVAAAAVLTLCGVLLSRHLASTAPRTSRRRRPVATKPLGVAGSRT